MILRWILFLPIYSLWLVFLYYGLDYIALKLMFNLNTWLFILLAVLLGGVIWVTFYKAASQFTQVLVRICPNTPIGGIVFTLLTIGISGYYLYKAWTIEEDYTGGQMVKAIILTIIILQLMAALIQGATEDASQEYKRKYFL